MLFLHTFLLFFFSDVESRSEPAENVIFPFYINVKMILKIILKLDQKEKEIVFMCLLTIFKFSFYFVLKKRNEKLLARSSRFLFFAREEKILRGNFSSRAKRLQIEMRLKRKTGVWGRLRKEDFRILFRLRLARIYFLATPGGDVR